MTSIEKLLAEGAARLGHEPSPRLDAEVLLAHLLGKTRTYLYTWPEQNVDEPVIEAFRTLIARRAEGTPVAHLLGKREFWSLELTVTPDTLIPRPETELLVEQALARIPPDAAWNVADLGTGSGAIALAIASERPRCHVIATDKSMAALEQAQANALRLGLQNVDFRLGSWFTPLKHERFAVIVSNPPYIRANDPHLLQGDVRFEPITALTSGLDGLDDLKEITEQAPDHLEPGGWLLLEHGYDQGEMVQSLLTAHGFIEVLGYRDGLGHERVATGRAKL